MATRKEIEDQIAALQQEAEAMGDDDNDFEVEIWNADGEGARVPYHKGKSWLQKFGIDLDPPEESASGTDNGTGESGNKAPSKAPPQRQSTANRYFGKRQVK